MLSFLIMEKAFFFMLYNKKMPIRLWTQSYTVCPICLQQCHRPVSLPQPQAQAQIPTASKASSRGVFATSRNFSSSVQSEEKKTQVFLRFSLLADIRQWRQHLIEAQIKQFWLFRQQDVNLGKVKETLVCNLAWSVETQTSCHYLNMLICLSSTDFTEKEFLPLVSSNRNV